MDCVNWSMNNNFFALFGLPVAFDIDKNALKQSFLTLQKQHHPDQNQHADSHQMAALINHAFNTLNRDDSRAAHLLNLAGIECNLDASINDWDFLDVMMDFRIRLDDADGSDEIQQLSAQLNQEKSPYHQGFIESYANKDWQSAQDFAQKLQFIDKLADDIELKLASSAIVQTDDDLYV